VNKLRNVDWSVASRAVPLIVLFFPHENKSSSAIKTKRVWTIKWHRNTDDTLCSLYMTMRVFFAPSPNVSVQSDTQVPYRTSTARKDSVRRGTIVRRESYVIPWGTWLSYWFWLWTGDGSEDDDRMKIYRAKGLCACVRTTSVCVCRQQGVLACRHKYIYCPISAPPFLQVNKELCIGI